MEMRPGVDPPVDPSYFVVRNGKTNHNPKTQMTVFPEETRCRVTIRRSGIRIGIFKNVSMFSQPSIQLTIRRLYNYEMPICERRLLTRERRGTACDTHGLESHMSTALKRITADEYLARERKAECKSEFFDGEVFAMAGGSPTHSLIAANFVGEARQSLNGTPCVVYNSDLRIKIQATGLYTYPDASIVCGDLKFDDEQRDTVTNPTVIVEVLSDFNEKYDRGRKSSHYRQVPSVREIILISQDEAHVERFVRQPEGGWLFLEERDPAGSFELSSLNVTIAMSELYRHVKFEAPTAQQ